MSHTRCEPTTEVSHGDSCYSFFRGELKTRDESHVDCFRRNSHLVYIQSDEEFNFLQTQTSTGQSSDYWIGLIPTLTWSDGSSIVLNLLSVSGSGGDRFYLSFDQGKVQVTWCYCRFQYRYPVCEWPKPRFGGCSSNLHEYGDSCYEVANSRSRYSSAETHCSSHEGHLLRIETQGELNFIQGLLVDGRNYWIDTKVGYRWMDGSPAFDWFVEDNSHGNLCFRLVRLGNPQIFQSNDQDCSRDSGYICERKEIDLNSGHREQEFSSCPGPIPEDLIRLGQRGSLCLYNFTEDIPPVLRECDTANHIEECGCVKHDIDGVDTVECGCGFCNLQLRESNGVWPSNFSCTCSWESITFSVTVTDGEFACVQDGTDNQRTTFSPPTMSDDVGTDSMTGSQIGIPIAVTLSLLFILVVIVVGLLWWRRRRRRSSKETDKQLTPSRHVASSDPVAGLNNGDNTESSGPHPNPVFERLPDDSEPHEAIDGYEDPYEAVSRQRPDMPSNPGSCEPETPTKGSVALDGPREATNLSNNEPKQYDYAAVGTSPAVGLNVNLGSDRGYVNRKMVNQNAQRTKNMSTPNQTKHVPQKAHPHPPPPGDVPSNYDYADVENLPLELGASLGPERSYYVNNKLANKNTLGTKDTSTSNQGICIKQAPLKVHPHPPGSVPSTYDYADIGNIPLNLGVSSGQEQEYVNKKVVSQHGIVVREQVAPKQSDDEVYTDIDIPGEDQPHPQPSPMEKVNSNPGGQGSHDDGSLQALETSIEPGKDPLDRSSDAFAYEEVPSLAPPIPEILPAGDHANGTPRGQDPSNDGGYQALSPIEVQKEGAYTSLIHTKADDD